MDLSIETLSVIAAALGALILLFLYQATRPEKIDLEKRLQGGEAFRRTYAVSSSGVGRFYKKRLRKLIPERTLSGFGKVLGIDGDALERKIRSAGETERTSVPEILLLKLTGVFVFILGMAAFLLAKDLFVLFVVLYASGFLFLVPEADLDRTIKKRREDISAHLMRYVENTRLCLIAGADLEESLKLIAENTEGDLSKVVLGAFVNASYTGSWEEELERCAEELKVEEFENFVSDIVTARRTGADMTKALLDEVDRLSAVSEARIMGEVKALPSKLGVLQIAFCMVPMFLIVLLPAAIQLMEVL